MWIFGSSERLAISQPQNPIRGSILLIAYNRQNTHRTVLCACLSFLILFNMSKNNWLRAKINREAKNNNNVSSIYSKTWRMWFYVYYAPKHYRSFRTWKHNRKQQFKIK